MLIFEFVSPFSDYHTRVQFHQCFMYSFYACRSQKRKKIQSSHKYLFTLLGSTGAKAVRRTLMILTLDVAYFWCGSRLCLGHLLRGTPAVLSERRTNLKRSIITPLTPSLSLGWLATEHSEREQIK